MQKIKERRRKYLINKPLQLQLATLVGLLGGIPIVVFGVSLYIVNKAYLFTMQKIIGDEVFSNVYIQEILRFSILALTACLIIVLLLVVFIIIRFSHHIAGPLYKLEQSLDELLKGKKIERLYFRKTDIVDGLADKFNTIIDRLNQIK